MGELGHRRNKAGGGGLPNVYASGTSSIGNMWLPVPSTGRYLVCCCCSASYSGATKVLVTFTRDGGKIDGIHSSSETPGIGFVDAETVSISLSSCNFCIYVIYALP